MDSVARRARGPDGPPPRRVGGPGDGACGRRVGAALESRGSDDAATAWLLAGRAALATRHEHTAAMLARAVAYRRSDAGLVRATGWQAAALLRDIDGDRRAVLAACRRGLDALDQHRDSLGSSELRALATRRGDELAGLALRHAVHGVRGSCWTGASDGVRTHSPSRRSIPRRRRPRSRPAALETPHGDSPRLARELFHRAATGGGAARLERPIRRRTHHLGGRSGDAPRFSAAHLLAHLDGTTFVELTAVDGVVHALVARSHAVRHVSVGKSAEAEHAATYARFALRQTARGRPSDLADVGRRLQEALLGDAVRLLGDGPVVVSPTSA